MKKLEIKGLGFGYDSSPVLKGITISAEKGEVVSLVGPNGSGKTTLIKCINRILKPQKGTILVDGKDTNKIKLQRLARMLAYVPQSTGHPFPSTVFDTVLLGRKPYVNWGISRENKEIVSHVLSLMGLEEMALRQFNELSGGERQKVLIARALAQEPEIILMDEPTSNLDLRRQLEVLNIIKSVVKERGITVIIAIHDLNLAARFSDKLIFLNKGRIHDVGKPSKILTRENVESVYGVKVAILKDLGFSHIVPLAPA